nr:unnamed protein product [Callosobruchus chinensis]
MAKQNLQTPATEVFPRTMATSGRQQKSADFSDALSSRPYKTAHEYLLNRFQNSGIRESQSMAPTNKTSVDTVDKNKCYICVKKLLRSSKVIICSVCEVSVHTECANYDEGSVSAYKCEKCTMNSSDTSIETVIDKHASGESYITQSVKAAPKKVSLFVSRLQSGTKSEDLVTALRETFPEAVCEEITPKHPESYASFKVKSFKGGGVGIWCKDSVEVKSIDLEKFCIEKSIEICGIIFENNGNKTAVLSCYRSPINQNFQVFCEKLEQIFEENFDSSTNFILCGDFNVDPIRDEINYKALTSILESAWNVVQMLRNKSHSRIKDNNAVIINTDQLADKFNHHFVDTPKNINSFKKFNVLTLPSIVIMELALLIYNNQNDFNRNKDFHDYSTRGREMYTIPLTKYRIGRPSPAFLGVKIFNKLGNDMKNIKNQITFKNKLKTFLLERCYYTIDEFLLE